MGLNMTHGCFDGPYSYFNAFREWIAKQIGFELTDMDGFGGVLPFDVIHHPIKPLLDHSDCDGELTPEQCKSVAEGGQMILDELEDPAEDADFVIRLQLLINGCRKAYNKGENVLFQ